jgi:hypothetical protein
MERIKMPVAVIMLAVMCLAVTTIVANSTPSSTPLYIFRMEQVSSKMNFLPTGKNEFTYTTERNYTLTYEIVSKYGAKPLEFTIDTCEPCETAASTCEITCQTCPSTCGNTCPDTCASTCGNTCPSTCEYTCPNTCSKTCNCPATLETCESTCPYTCPHTCANC